MSGGNHRRIQLPCLKTKGNLRRSLHAMKSRKFATEKDVSKGGLEGAGIEWSGGVVSGSVWAQWLLSGCELPDLFNLAASL